jgi:hypothetical protein
MSSELDNQPANHANGSPDFDYASVSRDVAMFLKGQAIRIRQYTGKSIIQIGKDLSAAKHFLCHGEFLRWVESEVGIPARTAQAYMQAALWVADKRAAVALLPPSLLFMLAAQSTPKDFSERILNKVEAGEHMPLKTIRAELKELRTARRAERICAPIVLRVTKNKTELQATFAMSSGDRALVEAIRILASALSDSDFAQIRAILTSSIVLEQSNLPQRIRTAFSAVDDSEEFKVSDRRSERSG